MLPTLILWQRQSPFHLKKDGVTWVNRSCIRVSGSFWGMSMGYVKWKEVFQVGGCNENKKFKGDEQQ
jgi:hypothetical protein